MGTFTGRARERTTPRSVKVAESTARVFIGIGGIGTIIAVTAIFAFLLWVVAPLFLGASVEEEATLPAVATNGSPIIATEMDEFRLMAWTLARDGKVTAFRLDDGSKLKELSLFEEKKPTAIALIPDEPFVTYGYGDGSIQTSKITFSTEFFEQEAVSEELRKLKVGEVAPYLDGLVQVTPAGQFRFQRLAVTLRDPLQAGDEAIADLDFSLAPSSTVYAVLYESGRLAVYTETEKTNLLTGETTVSLDELPIPYEPPPGRGRPDFVRISGVGTMVYMIWKDGHLVRYNVSDAANVVEAETVRLVEEGTQVTLVGTLIGKTTLLVGDTTGRTRAWFPTKPEDAGTVDKTVLVPGHTLEGPDAAVASLAPSRRTRLVGVGYADGTARVFYVTSENVIATAAADQGPVLALAVAPKEDGLLALTPGGFHVWSMKPGHPEASLGALFGKVWYESLKEPAHVWQSTGGTDDFEPKLGLVPLIFGTLKATLYSILIGAPIALLAAIFTSEFLEPKYRAPIKSVVEMMASLPSVVLGFLAALIIAPFVQAVVPATLLAFLTVPFAFLIGSRLWQLLPTRRAILWGGLPRVGMILVALAVGIFVAAQLGPAFERAYFGGNIKRWAADPAYGAASGGWAFLLTPVLVVVLTIIQTRTVGPWLRVASTEWSRLKCAGVDFARFGIVLVLAVGLAWAVGAAFAGLGWDTRGGIFDTYAQRNAMIVGFVMGFAIIPIIYTLAEDALSSVPRELREGSLGAGATPWQTARRIVIPAATSGLFGAMMVGLGRAVGETMIVLMAAGNTPILEWNVFAGFRTLSANIAVELPEAVKDSTHYRTLFLAAFVLFLMTFAINTFAEFIRRIFRRRFAEL